MATTKITNPDLFDITANTALRLPSGSTEQRPTSPSTGEWRYNTTTNLVEYYDGADWRELQSEDIPPIPSQNFNCVLYTGTGSAQSITGVGFQPDFVWIKVRSTSSSHSLTDSTRGNNLVLQSNEISAEASGQITLDSDGFTIGNGNPLRNSNGATYVAWCWKANGGTTSTNTDGSDNSTVQVNTKAGISIVQYTATTATSSSTAGHGLGTTPAMIILKRTDASEDWYIWHKDLGAGGSALNQYLRFTTASQATATNLYGIVNSTVFATSYTGSVPNTNIAYCFAEKAEYSKFGSYTGNGSSNGPIVNTGFEPAYIMIKNSTAIYEWTIYDNKRSTSNPRNNVLYPNTSGAQNSGETGSIDFLSNGFQLKSSDGSINQNGGIIIYAAFASDPSTAPVLADSFANKLYTGNATSSRAITGLGFKPNLVWIKNRSAVKDHMLFDSVRGTINPPGLYPNLALAQFSGDANNFVSFDDDGFTIGQDSYTNGSGNDMVAWSWKANSLPTINTDGTIQSVLSANQASGFSVVAYTGNSNTSQTVGHGLSAAPELVIIKNLDQAEQWNVFGGTVWDRINLDDSLGDRADGYACTFNSTNVELPQNGQHANGQWNASGNNYIMYCWQSITGFSKIGTYTGNGSTQSITGVGFQPSWIIFKKTTATQDWLLVDSARGGQKELVPNNNSAEYTMSNGVSSFDSDGWTMGANNSLNTNGETYLYMAFKENPVPIVPTGYMAFLTVAGGGGGGFLGGGAGAGGLRTSFGSSSGGGSSAESNITLAAETYTITIGSGGSGSTQAGANFNGTSGGDSSIAASSITTITSVGGGYGGNHDQTPPATGGSGGGADSSGVSRAGAAGTANQGFAGGANDPTVGVYTAGGGGGASAVGTAGTSSDAGNGGDGLAVSINGSSTTYAGGGGAGRRSGHGGGAAGTGGGGAGGQGAVGSAGTANTGGGAGGGGLFYAGGNGGSGIVILRMRTSDYSGTTTGSPTVTTVGEETILTYTGSGTYVHS